MSWYMAHVEASLHATQAVKNQHKQPSHFFQSTPIIGIKSLHPRGPVVAETKTRWLHQAFLLHHHQPSICGNIDAKPAPLRANPTVAQISQHADERTKRHQAMFCIQNCVSDVIFTRIMACETPKKAWDKLNEEF
ncbi:hypothetical protein CXB51_000697 [Gossypium anomalum]|uniref:Uncharacterized protein n=1 Tax=Gossypium anomalum TaxID=47600 RepID=A0A8J5ZAC5_9ROSI|nr:hypothetical protein CXB51_000697 [Gossypium anomalum]